MDEAALVEQVRQATEALPAEQLLFRVAPRPAEEGDGWAARVDAALDAPIGSPPLEELARGAQRVVILADDLTRPTPQSKILPPLLDRLNAAGVPDGSVLVIIALGTHRYMAEDEIARRFGPEVCRRVPIVNHDWRDPDTFVDLGTTENGTPVKVNRLACEADLLIGTGSIVPHVYAGWAGGAKILQPGVCSAETTARTHCMAAEGPDLLGTPGRDEDPVRHEIERVGRMAALAFIVNVVPDAGGAPVWVGAGDPVETHRAGIPPARRTYLRPVPARAEVVIADARPCGKDYWQGIKALAHAVRGVAAGGTVVFVGAFPEGVAPTHPEFTRHSLKSYDEVLAACRADQIEDPIASATLRLHALIMAHCSVSCVSPGMSVQDKARLGFRHAEDVGEALQTAFERHGAEASVGTIEYGGDVLPEPPGQGG